MATLEKISYSPLRLEFIDKKVIYSLKSQSDTVENFPLIFWDDNTPWREANLWAIERLNSGQVSIKTIISNMNGLLNYAKFLEINKLNWLDFPIRKENRCLIKYRGMLISVREKGQLSPSTASEYMRNCIMFYRWVRDKDLISLNSIFWQDKPFTAKFFDKIGFERTLSGITTDIRIPNRKRQGEILEDGLMPVSTIDRDIILDFVKKNSTPEVYLMLCIGFFTGMRLGSICDLKIATLERAVNDPSAKGLLRISVGPGAFPKVHTKYNITGQIWMPTSLRDELLVYAGSLRRMAREAKADSINRGLVFLTRFGESYSQRDLGRSSSINVEMSMLRKLGYQAGIIALRNFHFHQSRCTFGTELARLALLACPDVAIVVAIVGNALLHSSNSEAITFKYIKFVQSAPVKQQLANDFMTAFCGLSYK